MSPCQVPTHPSTWFTQSRLNGLNRRRESSSTKNERADPGESQRRVSRQSRPRERRVASRLSRRSVGDGGEEPRRIDSQPGTPGELVATRPDGRASEPTEMAPERVVSVTPPGLPPRSGGSAHSRERGPLSNTWSLNRYRTHHAPHFIPLTESGRLCTMRTIALDCGISHDYSYCISLTRIISPIPRVRLIGREAKSLAPALCWSMRPSHS